MCKHYVVTLKREEREQLLGLLKKGKASVRKLCRAQILLQADEGTIDSAFATGLHVARTTVERLRKRVVEEGLEAALTERRRPGAKPKLDGRQEAYLLALACSSTPQGRERWTMQLLAERVVEVGLVDSIRRHDQPHTEKNAVKPWLKQQWCIPTVSAEFVWRMEEILDLYALPYDSRYPPVFFDECPYQLVGEVCEPLPPRPGKLQRYDYHYRRNGTCNLFMFFAPQEGWRHVEVTERRTKPDFARYMQTLVDGYFPEAEKIRVVLDNLNTHTPAALYEVFSPPEARHLLQRLEFHYTPKHGSWLNMVEIELSVLAGQCLKRRLPTRTTVQEEIAAWERARNTRASYRAVTVLH